ncbi:MAG: carboxypeptidase-like regulatory domain-containing protein [Ferruginibacter sp.]
MKSKFFHLLAVIAITSMVIFAGCKKDISNNDPVPTAEDHFAIPAATPVTGSVSGIIVDENNTPVTAAEVKCSGSTFTTDANGFFVIKNVQLDKYVSTVTVNKAGYYKGIRSFSASPTMNYVSIKLIPKTLTGTTSATAGGAVDLPNGTILTLQSNSVVLKSSGAAYSGTVNVYASYVDPTTGDFSARVPGSLMGQDTDNMYVLASTGMLAVELESATGEALQLATGKPASIKLPIPSSLTSKAPATIDTWSLDDRGIWIKEGSATKNGDFYEMQVSHFSFWNCDFPSNAIYLTIHVQDQNNQPLTNTLVELTVPPSVTIWTTTYGYTDSLGNVSGLVPSGTDIDLSLLANPYNCPSSLYNQIIGPFAANASITVTATLSSSQSLVINGTANDCNNQPIQDGTAAIYAGQYGAFYSTITNGNYSLTIPYCNSISSVNVTVLDNNSQAYASSTNITVSSNSLVVPLLTACSTGLPAAFNVIGCQLAGTYTVGTAPGVNNYLAVAVEVTTPGTYSVSQTLSNGVTFSGSGTFTTLGPQSIQLQASGTPTSAGTSLFTLVFANGTSGCTVDIYVFPMQAVFSLGGPGACNNTIVNGTYLNGQGLNTSNNIVITIDVSIIGDYYISTDSTNGYGFQASGSFTNTGIQTVVLMGYGNPQVAGTDLFTAQANGVTGCTFTVDVAVGPDAVFTFSGAPGTCTNYGFGGTLVAGVPVNSQNFVVLNVNVTTTGPYSITTNTSNGMSFSGTGVLQNLGTWQIIVPATGTPANTGVYTYIPVSGSTTGCVFTATVN